eukprot:TRINITY_DN16576_c0_g1_i1.p1 TRINITY_DN16576_c0_g1~~TRINITY_DN16576_c0_g1_i1.p1  ORF type:complete len:176 (-),score=34.49 TRINITY_DN16576_c0_g1_i1:184-711(-)
MSRADPALLRMHDVDSQVYGSTASDKLRVLASDLVQGLGLDENQMEFALGAWGTGTDADARHEQSTAQEAQEHVRLGRDFEAFGSPGWVESTGAQEHQFWKVLRVEHTRREAILGKLVEKSDKVGQCVEIENSMKMGRDRQEHQIAVGEYRAALHDHHVAQWQTRAVGMLSLIHI